jgi:hypothetical protein
MEITKEYLDKQFGTLTADIATLKEGVATKQDVRDAVDELARITNAGFEAIYQRLDVREQVEKHEHDIQELKKALDLT